jgi:GT2 family glycosyltransferase
VVGIDPAADDLDVDAAQVPAVVAVVVTLDPGDWLEECLVSLAAQDYPNLSTLVIDAGSAVPVLSRVAPVLPSAYVRRIDTPTGFGAAANDVLEVVDGATFFVFCHDDVILDTGAVRALVEESFRSNAGIAGPKLVDWHAPDHLLEVGMAADKGGVLSPLVERGELDQEQHDAVRDVFVIPGGCTLVRADLFATIGGFDSGIDMLGEDLDLCWRAQVAGARVVVVPGARVQHRETLARSIDVEDARLRRNRHRLRSVLTCYGRLHLARVLPQLALLSVLEVGYCVATRRRRHARGVVRAWLDNLRARRDITARRRALRDYRRFPDSEVRRLQVRGSVRVRRFLRGELDTRGIHLSIEELEHELEEVVASPSRRLEIATAVVVGLVVLFGTRELWTGSLPAVAGFVPFDDGPAHLLREYLTGWRAAGLGGAAPAPTAVLLLAALGASFFGAMGALQHALVLGAVPVGLIGVWRLTGRLGSPRGRAAALALYAVVPVPWNAVARGSWAGLLLYGAAPWLLDALLATAGDPLGDVARPRRPLWWSALAVGVPLAFLAAFVPLAVALLVVVAAALLVGDLIAGRPGASMRPFLVAVGAGVVAVVLHLPWSVDLLAPGAEWTGLAGVAPLAEHGIAATKLVRFATGPYGASPLGWAVPAAALLPLAIGREWRWRWAVRCWVVALVCWALAWAGGAGHLGGVTLPPADMILAPAAAALALAAALGIVAFERDLSAYRFGWPQAASVLSTIALGLAVLPSAVGAFNGRWHLPTSDDREVLAPVLAAGGAAAPGSYRVLWLGSPSVLPVAGQPLGPDLGYALTQDGPGRLSDRWGSAANGATPLVASALRLSTNGGTDRLGRLLAPFGIRYVIAAGRSAPARTHAERRPVPAGLVDALASQLDLNATELDADLTVYENGAWVPVRTVLPDDAAAVLDRSSPFVAAAAGDIPSGTGVLPPAGTARFRGPVGPGQLYAAWSYDPRWRLRETGQRTPHRRALGWANAWSTAGGEATLSYATSPLRPLSVVLQVALWVAAVALVVRGRRRRLS